MKDPRIDKLARQTVEYSLSLGKGQKLLIEAWDGCDDFVLPFIEAAQRVSALPYVVREDKRVLRALILGGNEAYWKQWYDYQIGRMEDMDAFLSIRKEDNCYELADVPNDKAALYNKYNAMLHNKQRNFKMKWCILRYPNPAMAQLSQTSTEAFEDLFFAANCIDYKRLNEIAMALYRVCHRTDQVRIVAPGTDLTFSIKGQCGLYACCGVFNRPCGETGMTIVQGTANGTIRYNIPSLYQGTNFENVELTFRDGVIVHATSNHTELLNRILDTDPGARRIGEFALGFNPLITKPMHDTLFDEKMRMSLHFTPGNGSNNPSAIHWDLVQSHDPAYGGGEVWFDGVLIRKDGLFVTEELKCMNPDELMREIM
ncbi:MAG: aminopeptidase [Clostridia bacterium]|nr:aminopeptidase [Clostridia bacterium]